ncbi:MAG TPA: hypothetical protein VIS78_03330 [Blastocatellia bacterium]
MSVTQSESRSFMSVSSNMLDMHLQELTEECARFVAMIEALRTMSVSPEPADEEVRGYIEANLYASLSHMNNHVQPAMDEWDRLVESLPNDDEDSVE